jgi:two-component system sensor histidine kinase DesK
MAKEHTIGLLPPDDEMGWTNHLYLVYLAPVLFYAYFSRPFAGKWALTFGAIAVFLVLYYRAKWLTGKALLPVVFAIAALGAALAPHNAGASAFFIYAAVFATRSGPPAFAYRILGVLLAVIALEAWFFHLSYWFWAPGLVFCVVTGAVGIRGAEVRMANAELRTAREEVERLAKLAERERIARDLHDVLGHTLSVIVLKSELAAKLAASDLTRAAQEIRDVERIARESLSELRQALAGYRAAGIAAEIDRANEVLKSAGVHLECDVQEMRLPLRHESTLALAIREATTNVVRHAHATSCRLEIAASGATCNFVMRDNGCGNDAPNGFGLSGMRERVEALGGTFARDVSSGTCLRISLPLGEET